MSVNALAYGPDGTWFVSGSGTMLIRPSAEDASVELRDSVSGHLRRNFRGLIGSLYGIAVSPDGHFVAAGSGCIGTPLEARVAVWDVSTGQTAWIQSEPGFCAMSVAFSPDSKSLAVGYGLYSTNPSARSKSGTSCPAKKSGLSLVQLEA